MAYHLRDGSIISNAFPIGRRKTHFQRSYENYGVTKARVDEVIYVDDERNTTRNTNNPQVEYVCTVLGGSEAGRRLHRVRSIVPLGSGAGFNSGEIIHTPRLENSPQDKDGDQINQPEKTTGAMVLISKLHGANEHPVIIGNLKHPKSQGATKEDGQRLKYEFMGMAFEVTKDGAFSMSFGGGPKDKDGKATDDTKAGGTFQISKDGVVKIADGDGQEISIDKTNKKVSIKSSQGLEQTAGSDWTINISANAKINAGGTLDLIGAVTNIGQGGFQAARMNDLVMGTDSQGGPIIGYIAVGSPTVMIGG